MGKKSTYLYFPWVCSSSVEYIITELARKTRQENTSIVIVKEMVKASKPDIDSVQ